MEFSVIESGAADILETNRKTPVKCLKEIRACSFKKVTWLVGQLRCLYTNACSMYNKQEELEATVQLENCDQNVITEIW